MHQSEDKRIGNQIYHLDQYRPVPDVEPASSLPELMAYLGLSKEPVQDPVKVLKDQHASWKMLVKAIRQLSEPPHPQAIPYIEKYLSHQHEAVRMAAARALGNFWRANMLLNKELLLRPLLDKHPFVQATAIQTLASLGPEILTITLVDSLIQRLHNAESKSILRVAIIQLLGKTRFDISLHELVRALDDKDWQVRENAAVALGQLIDMSASKKGLLIKKLHDALYDPVQHVRLSAASALGKHLQISGIINVLQYDKPAKQMKAAQILGELSVKTAIHDLLKVAKQDRDDEVRTAAILALGKIGEQMDEIELKKMLPVKVLEQFRQKGNGDVSIAAEVVLDSL